MRYCSKEYIVDACIGHLKMQWSKWELVRHGFGPAEGHTGVDIFKIRLIRQDRLSKWIIGCWVTILISWRHLSWVSLKRDECSRKAYHIRDLWPFRFLRSFFRFLWSSRLIYTPKFFFRSEMYVLHLSVLLRTVPMDFTFVHSTHKYFLRFDCHFNSDL